MAKVAIFVNSLAGGGMERAMINLAKHFASEGVKVDLLVASKKGPLKEDVPIEVNLIDLKKCYPKVLPARLWLFISAFSVEPKFFIMAVLVKRIPKSVRVIPSLIDYLTKNTPDIIISTPTSANLAAIWSCVCARFSGKLLIREASTLSSEMKFSKALFSKFVPSLVEKWYRKSDCILCVSDGVKNDLLSAYTFEDAKLLTAYNILDIDWILEKSLSSDFNSQLESYGRYVLSVGRLEEQKNFEMLIQAFDLIHKHVDVNLVILGEGSLRSKLESLVESLNLSDRVYLPGYVNNPYPFIARCEVFALTSLWEGCPNVIREAKVLRRKIVSTDGIACIKELLTNGEYEGLVSAGDIQCYSQELQRLLEISDCNENAYESEAMMRENALHLYNKLVLQEL